MGEGLAAMGKGKVLNNSRVDNDISKISEFFDRLDHTKTTKVVMESSGLWYNIYEYLSKRYLDVAVPERQDK